MIKRFLLFLVGVFAFPFIEDNKFQRKLKCFLNELVPDPLPIFAVNGLYGVDPQFDKFSLLMRIEGFNETSKKRSMMVQLLQTHEQAFQVFFYIFDFLFFKYIKVQFQHARYLQAEPEQISSTGMVYIKTTYTHFDPLRSFRVHMLQFHEEGEAYIETQQTFDLTTYKIIYRHQQQYIVKILFITPLYHKFKGSREQIDELKHKILSQNWIDCTYNQCSLNKLIVNSVKALKFQQIYPKYIKKGYLKLNDRLLPLELHNNILLGFIRQSSQLYLDINFYCQLEDRIKIETSYLNYQGFQYYCTDYYVYKLILTNALNDQIIDDHFNLEQENNFLAFIAFQTNEKQSLEDLFKNISYQIISGQDKSLAYQCNQIVLLIHQQLIINIDYIKDLKQPIQDLNITNYQENNTILIQETFSPLLYQEKQEINLTQTDNNSLLNKTNESPQLEQEQLNQTINKGFDTILLSLQQLINKKKNEGHKHTKVRHRKHVQPLIVDKIEVEFNVPVQMIEDQKLTISKIQVQLENELSCEEEIKPENDQKENQEECEEVAEGNETQSDQKKDKDDDGCEEEVKLQKEEQNCEEDEQKNEEIQEQEEDDEQKQKQKNKKKKDDEQTKEKKEKKGKKEKKERKQNNKSKQESEDEQFLYDQNGNKIKNSYRVHKGRDPYQYQHKHHLRRRHYISKKPVFQTRYFKGDNDNKPSQYETYVGNNEQNPKFKVYYKIEDDPNVFSPFQENDDHLLQRYRHHHNDHDSSCYKFYDDCYYTGRMLEFCQNHPFMREENIGFQIFSYYIPKGMWVRLYQQNEYDEITVQGTNQCLNDPLTLQRNFDI